jgi:hypothetical protein
VAVRRRSADERNNGGLLDAVEHSLGAWSRLVSESGLEAARVVPICDTLHLSVVPTYRLRGCEHRHPLVEMFECEDSPPGSGRQLLPGLELLQLFYVWGLQLEAGCARGSDLHPNA